MTIEQFYEKVYLATLESEKALKNAYKTITMRLENSNMTWEEMKNTFDSLETYEDKLKFGEGLSGKLHLNKLIIALE